MAPLERVVRFRARTVLAVLGIILAVFALLQVVWLARQVLTWILIAFFFALALDPVVEPPDAPRDPAAGLAIGVDLLLLLGVVVLLGSTFIPTLVNKVNNFVDAVPDYVRGPDQGPRPARLPRDRVPPRRARPRAASRTSTSVACSASPGQRSRSRRACVTVIVATITIVVLTSSCCSRGRAGWSGSTAAPAGVAASLAEGRQRRLRDGRRLRHRQPGDRADRRHHDRRSCSSPRRAASRSRSALIVVDPRPDPARRGDDRRRSSSRPSRCSTRAGRSG